MNLQASQTKAYLCALLTVLMWSTVASAFKISLRYLDYFQLLFLSSLSATLCLLVCIIIQGKLIKIFSCSPAQYLKAFLAGLLNPLSYYLILFKAYELLPAQVAQPLNYTWAITLTLLSIPLLKQKISCLEFLAILISYCGVIIIIGARNPIETGQLDPLGISLALGSTLIWALYWIYNTRQKLDPVIGLFLNFALSLPVILIVCVSFSSIDELHLYGIFGAIYIGFFEMGFPFVLWLIALRLSDSVAKISTLIFLSPFLSLIFIHYLVGEPIVVTTITGLLVIIAGLVMQHRVKSKTVP